jgi:hypothetical protein
MAVAKTSTRRPAHGGVFLSLLSLFLVGPLLLYLFMVCTGLHIWTSEAFFLPLGSVAFFPNASIFFQLWHLSHGDYAVLMSTAVVYGWFIEAVFLICIIGYDVIHGPLKNATPRLAELCRFISIVLVLFDGFSDFRYTTAALGPLYAFIWSLVCCLIVFFAGTAGFSLVLYGITGIYYSIKSARP